MARVMAVALGPFARLHYLDAGDGEYRHGDAVLVPTEDGTVVAKIVWGPSEVDWLAELPVCAGKASEDDLARHAAGQDRRKEIRRVATELIRSHRLPMTVVGVDHIEDSPGVGRVAVVYFKAPHRVDFRALVGDLARGLQARVDLRQVGARDVAAVVGGIGSCGRELCCCAGCPVREPMSAAVSRDQELANNALQLAGVCGRLKCCMAYESGAYADFLERAPGVGSVVATDAGEGVVSGYAQPIDAVWVRGEDGVRSVALAELTVVRPAPEAEQRAGRPAGLPAEGGPDEAAGPQASRRRFLGRPTRRTR